MICVTLNVREGSYDINTPSSTCGEEVGIAGAALAKLRFAISSGVMFDSYTVVVNGSTIELKHGDELIGEHVDGYRKATMVLRDKAALGLVRILAEDTA